MNDLAKALRRRLVELLEPTPSDVAILLSGGIDSNSLAIVLRRDLGRRVVAYSFTFDGYVSTDFSLARHNARALGIEFVPVWLPADLETLETDVRLLIDTWGCTGKTEIECLWPMLYALDVVFESAVVTGAAADGHFGLSKQAMIHYRRPREKFDSYRRRLFADPGYAQVEKFAAIATATGKVAYAPYRSRQVFDLLIGYGHSELNRPGRQKAPIRDAFPELSLLSTQRQHVNLQCGDSRISSHFKKLLDNPRLNKGGRKSVVGIYNDIAKGLV